MLTLPIDDILIGEDRQRTLWSDDALSELADSIAEIGLLHPPVINGSGKLIAGERRVRACALLALQDKPIRYGGQVLPIGKIPVHDLGDVSSLLAYQAELEENIVRVDLNWQDRTRAIAKMHELQQLLAAERGEQWGPADTAAKALPERPSGRETVRQSIALVEHLDDPTIAKATSQAQAFKLLQRKKEIERSAELGRAVGKLSASSLHRVIQADCLDWLDEEPDNQFDCILIDPPYGMGADDFGDGAGRLTSIDHRYDDSAEHFTGLMNMVITNLYDKLKAEGHLYIWCDIDGFTFLRDACRAAGFWTFRTPLINIKREGGRVPWPEHGPRRCYELVLYAVKGKKPVTAIYRDVFESTLSEGSVGHGAQKPVEAYIELLKRSCRPGDSVLDCFAGTGTILSAAHALKLRATAVEKSDAYYGLCVQRLNELEGEAR